MPARLVGQDCFASVLLSHSAVWKRALFQIQRVEDGLVSDLFAVVFCISTAPCNRSIIHTSQTCGPSKRGPARKAGTMLRAFRVLSHTEGANNTISLSIPDHQNKCDLSGG